MLYHVRVFGSAILIALQFLFLAPVSPAAAVDEPKPACCARIWLPVITNYTEVPPDKARVIMNLFIDLDNDGHYDVGEAPPFIEGDLHGTVVLDNLATHVTYVVPTDYFAQARQDLAVGPYMARWSVEGYEADGTAVCWLGSGGYNIDYTMTGKLFVSDLAMFPC